MKKRLNRIAVAVFFVALSIVPTALSSSKHPALADGMPGTKHPSGIVMADGMPGTKNPGGGGGIRLADGMPGTKHPSGIVMADGNPGTKNPGGGGVRPTTTTVA